MANLVLYKNISDNNKINKDITFIDERQCTFKEGVSLDTPIVTINYDVGAIVEKQLNYCYLANFGRYYYINDIVCLSGGLLELHLKCDVLMSFKDSFINTNFLINRCSNRNWRNPDLVDSEAKLSNDAIISYKLIDDTCFNVGEYPNVYIMTVAGGA